MAITEMRPSTGGLAPSPPKPRQAAPAPSTDGNPTGTLAEQRGLLFAIALFIAMFALYLSKHPAGFSARVVNTAANTGTLLALAAMAQTIPVLTAGLDLSVGMVMVLANCLASTLMNGSPLQTAAGVLAILVVGLYAVRSTAVSSSMAACNQSSRPSLPARFIMALHSG